MQHRRNQTTSGAKQHVIFLQAIWQWHSMGLFLQQRGDYTGTRLPLNRVSSCEMRVGNISKNNGDKEVRFSHVALTNLQTS
jgi:hypothetical protein